jgi:hypothetical protein
VSAPDLRWGIFSGKFPRLIFPLGTDDERVSVSALPLNLAHNS